MVLRGSQFIPYTCHNWNLWRYRSWVCILRIPPPPPFYRGGSKFWLSPPEGGQDSEKLKKGSESIVQGQVFLGGTGSFWHFSYLIISRFIIFTFRNYFTHCKIVLSIWRKIIFFCHYDFMKKVILSCLKMNLKISHKFR